MKPLGKIASGGELSRVMLAIKTVMADQDEIHLAQLASMADSHYCIEKQAVDGSTQTRIRKLSQEEITEELARILGGARITDAVRWNAMEMKRLALQFKNETGKT